MLGTILLIILILILMTADLGPDLECWGYIRPISRRIITMTTSRPNPPLG
jgi:hypothetical protein